ncbi:MAG: hypothetical protein ACT4NX_00990 [Deltaproteobacteria bacterium]
MKNIIKNAALALILTAGISSAAAFAQSAGDTKGIYQYPYNGGYGVDNLVSGVISTALGIAGAAIGATDKGFNQYPYDYNYPNNGGYNDNYYGDDDRNDYRRDQRQLARAAAELFDEANQFWKRTDEVRGYNFISQDARQFARDIRDFRQRAERGTNSNSLARDFRQLTNEFRILRNNFYSTHSRFGGRNVLRDWRDVESAWGQFNYTFAGNYNNNGNYYGGRPGYGFGYNGKVYNK